MIFEIVIVFDPELSFRVHNKLHQPPSRIAYMDLGIVPLAASAFFFWIYPAHFPVFSTFGLSRTKMRGNSLRPLLSRIGGIYTRLSCFWASLANLNRLRSLRQLRP